MNGESVYICKRKQNVDILTMDSCKKVKYDNTEMANFLQNFPIEESSKDVGQSLMRLENDVIAIRSQLERKVKKITLAQIDRKLDTILKILMQNGLTENCANERPIQLEPF